MEKKQHTLTQANGEAKASVNMPEALPQSTPSLGNNLKQNPKEGKRELKDLAKQLLSKGLQPIPLAENEKRPNLKSWKEYQQRKMTPEEVDRYEWYGIGLILGSISDGLVVFDADTNLAVELLESHPILSDTAKVKTPTKGGIHYYLKIDNYPKEGIKNKQIYSEDIKIDLKGEGGYVVIPPTELDGKKYEWLIPLDRAKSIHYSDFEKLLEEITQSVKRYNKWKETLKLISDEYQEGQRQKLILYLSGYLAKKGIPEFESLTFLGQLIKEKNDEEKDMRIRAIRDTYKDLREQGENAIAGWQKLQEDLNLPQETLTKLGKIWNDTEKVKQKSQKQDSGEFKWDGDYLIEDGKVKKLTRKRYEILGPYLEVKEVLFDEEDGKRYIVARFKNREFIFTMREAKERIEDYTCHVIKNRSEYLTWLSQKVENVPEKRLIKSTGWNEDFTEFYHPALETEGKDWVFEKDHVLKKEKRATIQYTEEQKAFVRETLREGKYLGVLYVCAFIGPLLKLLNIEPFVVAITGESKAGKSTATQLATQLFYKNIPAIANGLQTRNSWEFHLKGFRDMPFLFDELTLMDDEMVEFVAFAVHSGYGKSRGSVDKRVDRIMIRSVVLVNAERFPYSAIKNAGAHRRVLRMTVTKREDITNLFINERIKNAVGFGFELIDFAKKVLEEDKDIIDQNFGHLQPIHRALETALYIFEKYYGETFDNTRYTIDQLIIEQETKFAEENNHVQKFLDKVKEDISANAGVYYGSGRYKGDDKNIRGKIEKSPDGRVIVYLTSATFNELLKENGKEVLNRDTILSVLKAQNRLKTDKDKKRNTATVWLNGATIKAYAIIFTREEIEASDNEQEEGAKDLPSKDGNQEKTKWITKSLTKALNQATNSGITQQQQQAENQQVTPSAKTKDDENKDTKQENYCNNGTHENDEADIPF